MNRKKMIDELICRVHAVTSKEPDDSEALLALATAALALETLCQAEIKEKVQEDKYLIG